MPLIKIMNVLNPPETIGRPGASTNTSDENFRNPNYVNVAKIPKIVAKAPRFSGFVTAHAIADTLVQRQNLIYPSTTSEKLMKNIDLMSLDGRSLQIFLSVFEEMSVSKAAERLDLTQPTVSHVLDKLRRAFGDPLFVRCGRGIAATERAVQLREPILALVDELTGLGQEQPFNPGTERLEFTIAANDFQRDHLFPIILRNAWRQNINLHLKFIPSGVPKLNILESAQCDLIVTPKPPTGNEIVQTKLFEARHVCYYDEAVRRPPATMDEYLDSRHAVVMFDDHSKSWDVMPDHIAQIRRELIVAVPNFSSLTQFILGTDVIATEYDAMADYLLPLQVAPTPFDIKAGGMYMCWHRRHHKDTKHKWLREQVKNTREIVPDVVGINMDVG